MLEEIRHEPREILSLLRELLDEVQEPGGIAVDDQVADPKERFLLDRAEELEDGLDRDPSVRRGGQLVERRDGIAEASARAARDQGERRVRGVDLLSIGDLTQQPGQLGQTGTREQKRLAARPDRGKHLSEVGRAEDE